MESWIKVLYILGMISVFIGLVSLAVSVAFILAPLLAVAALVAAIFVLVREHEKSSERRNRRK